MAQYLPLIDISFRINLEFFWSDLGLLIKADFFSRSHRNFCMSIIFHVLAFLDTLAMICKEIHKDI